MSELISRQAAIDAVMDEFKRIPTNAIRAKIRIEALPPAQPEPNYDEWCTDCKEYDTERHCCPRWNKVIRQTLADAQPQRTGHWVDGKCDKCGKTALYDAYGLWAESDFCPHCGVKMKGKNNESN